MEAEAVDRSTEPGTRPAGQAGLRALLRLAIALALAALVTGGCATSNAMRKGRDAEQVNDYDRAVIQYTQAVKQKPDNADARVSLERAKIRASEFHFNRGRRLSATGKLEEALVE
jgi:hypothetical protein